jgi:hypothetical protein
MAEHSPGTTTTKALLAGAVNHNTVRLFGPSSLQQATSSSAPTERLSGSQYHLRHFGSVFSPRVVPQVGRRNMLQEPDARIMTISCSMSLLDAEQLAWTSKVDT